MLSLLPRLFLLLALLAAAGAAPAATSLNCNATYAGKVVINEVNTKTSPDFVELYFIQDLTIPSGWSVYVDTTLAAAIPAGTYAAGTFLTIDTSLNPSNQEVMITTGTPAAGAAVVVDYLGYGGSGSFSPKWTVPAGCGTTYTSHNASNDDIARIPDGSGTWGDNGSNVTKGESNLATWLIADFRFDECTWTSGTSGAVKDSGNNAYHGTPTGVTTAAGGAVQRAADFTPDGTGDNLVWPTAIMNGRSDFTISLWFKSSVNKTQQEILQGLGSTTGNDQVEIYLKGSYQVVVNIRDSADLTFDANYILTDGAWHHLAVTRSSTQGCLYIDGNSRGCKTYTSGALAITAGTLITGQEQDSFGGGFSNTQSLRAQLDELKFFSTALSATSVSAIRNNEKSGRNWDGSARAAVSCTTIDHYEIDVPPVGLTCQDATLNLRACATATAPCTGSLATTAATATLSASSGAFTSAGGATQTFTGSTSYTLSVTTPATVAIGLASPAATAYCYSYDGTTRTLLGTCAYDAKKAVFQFDVPNFNAGDGSGTVTINAWREDDTTRKCVSFTPTGSVKLWTTYVDPASGSKQATLTYGSTAYTLPTAKPGSGNVPLAFDASGQASFSVNYLDAGQLRLDAEWNSITGYSSFVVRPYFALSGIACADGTANPAATGAAGAKFCRAGQNFGVTVSAVTSDGTTATPNFGRETTPESALLTAALVAPAGGTAPALGGSLGAFADVGVARQASGSSFTWGEVGVISLTPGIADGDYLGAGDVAGTAIPYVGRFYPDHLETTATPGCSAAFTYSGQPFPLKVAAYRSGGSGSSGLTTNYDSALGFSKVVTLAAAGAAGAITGGDVTATQFAASHFASGATPDLTDAAALQPVFTFSTSPTAAATVTLRATDSDGVTSSGAAEGSMETRSGRLWMGNAYGSELLPLPVPMQLQYWTGGAWARNAADSCTALTVPTSGNGGLVFGPATPRNQLSAGETTASLASPVTAGNPGFRLTAPGSGNFGYVDIAGTVVRGTSTWLTLPNATARACFGVCGPRNPVIYQREMF